MLILGRKEGEALLIGDDIRISVLAIEKGRVRLAIDAPKNISILRSELRSAMDFNQDAGPRGEFPSEYALFAGPARWRPYKIKQTRRRSVPGFFVHPMRMPLGLLPLDAMGRESGCLQKPQKAR